MNNEQQNGDSEIVATTEVPSDLSLQPSRSDAPVAEAPKYRIWAMACPFKKSGFPVVGTFGATVRNVVIFDVATWTRLCQDVPQLQTTQFEVGTLE